MTEWDSSPEGKAYHKKVHQEWREKNREKANEYHREYMKTWRELNRDRINQKTKEWQIANHEKVKEYRRRYMAKWRDEHREQYREYMKRWKAEHPEGKDTHTMTKEEWLEKYGYPMGDTSGWGELAGMGYKDKERSGRLKDERYAEFEKDCASLIGNVTDALFVAWGKGILRGRQEEHESYMLEMTEREEIYQKGYADGMKEAIRTAERMVSE